MGKPAIAVPQDRLDLYEQLVATKPGAECKGVTAPYTSLNGHMYSFLTKEGTLTQRLPAQERESCLEEYSTVLCQQHGRVLKEYVEVPDHLLDDTAKLAEYFDASHQSVSSLKPKPTKRKVKK